MIDAVEKLKQSAGSDATLHEMASALFAAMALNRVTEMDCLKALMGAYAIGQVDESIGVTIFPKGNRHD